MNKSSDLSYFPLPQYVDIKTIVTFKVSSLVKAKLKWYRYYTHFSHNFSLGTPWKVPEQYKLIKEQECMSD